jgi:hypothetical protein
MPIPNDAYRRFQEELAALDRKAAVPAMSDQDRLARAKTDFLALRERYGLTVADVVAFFPEEDGIDYLQKLIAQAEAPPRRTRKRADPMP